MKNLIVKAISWISGIERYLLIIDAFRDFKYLLKDKVKWETYCGFHLNLKYVRYPFSRLGADFYNHHKPTRWLLGFLIIDTFLNALCIDWHMACGGGFEGCKTIFY